MKSYLELLKTFKEDEQLVIRDLNRYLWTKVVALGTLVSFLIVRWDLVVLQEFKKITLLIWVIPFLAVLFDTMIISSRYNKIVTGFKLFGLESRIMKIDEELFKMLGDFKKNAIKEISKKLSSFQDKMRYSIIWLLSVFSLVFTFFFKTLIEISWIDYLILSFCCFLLLITTAGYYFTSSKRMIKNYK